MSTPYASEVDILRHQVNRLMDEFLATKQVLTGMAGRVCVVMCRQVDGQPHSAECQFIRALLEKP